MAWQYVVECVHCVFVSQPIITMCNIAMLPNTIWCDYAYAYTSLLCIGSTLLTEHCCQTCVSVLHLCSLLLLPPPLLMSPPQLPMLLFQSRHFLQCCKYVSSAFEHSLMCVYCTRSCACTALTHVLCTASLHRPRRWWQRCMHLVQLTCCMLSKQWMAPVAMWVVVVVQAARCGPSCMCCSSRRRR